MARSRPSEKFGTDSRAEHVTTLGAMKAYYDARAPEYDEWYAGQRPVHGAGAGRVGREGRRAGADVGAMPPARTLDVACGTGFLRRQLPGEIVGLDQSERMLEVARRAGCRRRRS